MFEQVKRNHLLPAVVHAPMRLAVPRPPVLPPIARLVVLMVLGCALVGCGPPDQAPNTPEPTPGPPDEVALAVTVVTAFPTPAGVTAPAQPSLLVLGDGSFRATVRDDGRVRLLTGRLDADTVTDLLEAGAALPDDGYGGPGLDGSTTTVTLGRLGAGRPPRELSVWVPESTGYQGEERRNCAALVDLLAMADDAVRTAGAAWEPEQWFLLNQSPAGLEPQEPRPAWPLDLDPRGTVASADVGLGCQVVDARVAERVRRLLEDRGPGPVRWTYVGSVQSVVLLPVLARETCAELAPYDYPLG